MNLNCQGSVFVSSDDAGRECIPFLGSYTMKESLVVLVALVIGLGSSCANEKPYEKIIKPTKSLSQNLDLYPIIRVRNVWRNVGQGEDG